MSKKGCLVIIAVFVFLGILVVSCAGVCVLSSALISKYSESSLDMTASKTIRQGDNDKIVVIQIEGTILDSKSSGDIFSSSIASSQTITKYLNNAIKDDSVKAIILNMNTPGGDVYASDEIYKKVKEAQGKGKKVITLMRGTAASGGYYIAAPSDKIVASPLTITGSIGVLAQFQSLDGLYEKLGIKTRIITNTGGVYKTGEGIFTDPEGEEYKIYQKIIDDTFDRFVTIVAEGRKMDKNDVLKLATGRIYSGLEAKEIGLVDSFGSFDDAVIIAEKEAGITNATIVEYKGNDFWSLFSGAITRIVNPSAQLFGMVDTQPGLHLSYIYTEK